MARKLTMGEARKSSGTSQQWGASARVGAPKDQPADDPWAANATAGFDQAPPF